jgi:hypothetical protein
LFAREANHLGSVSSSFDFADLDSCSLVSLQSISTDWLDAQRDILIVAGIIERCSRF